MLRLAVPLAAAEFGWMIMGTVDTIMAGPLGAAALGAGNLGNMMFFPVVIFGTGLLLGMDTLVSQSFGAQDARDCRRTLVNGVWIALALAPFLSLIVWGLLPLLARFGTNPRVMVLLVPYQKASIWGIPPLLLYAAFRRYVQAVNIVKPVTFALISANVVNFLGNYALMYGHFGAPRMGLEGSGWSTSISRVYMAGVLAAAILWNERRTGNLLFHISWLPDLARVRHLLRLGLPAALQILAEGAVFGVVTALIGKLDEVSQAAHAIAINMISTTFMVPLGISSAAAVRVGQAIGGGQARDAGARGWMAMAFGATFMGAAAIALWVAPAAIVRLFTRDAAVVAAGTVLLRIAAVFELFDGLQVTATGALRGLGDTRTPMLAHAGGYWILGMPLGCWLCFHGRWGVPGIWVGLSAALIVIGVALVVVWARRIGAAH
jgi:MATE family multidrug resistance protein